MKLRPVETLRGYAVHTVTTKPWPLETAIDAYARAGFGGISIWRDTVADRDPVTVRRRLRDAGLTGVSLVRGGFFASADASMRRKALQENRRCIGEAHEIGLPLLVLVCGADPRQSLSESRTQITHALIELVPEAEAAGVRLGIEALHPMYAGERSAVNTLTQSNDLALRVLRDVERRGAGEVTRRVAREVGTSSSAASSPRPAAHGPVGFPTTSAITPPSTVCSVIDIYHLWWDPRLEEEIQFAAEEGLFGAYHISDWNVPTQDMLLDRGLMGEGCIDIPQISHWVAEAGFKGFTEVEIFSSRYWSMDQHEWLGMVAEACRKE